MKLAALLLFASAAFAQTTVTISIAGETNTTATFSTEFVTGLTAWIESIPGITGSFSLTAAAQSSDTTFTLSGPTGLQAGMGIMIDSEVSLVVSTGPLVVQRGRLGTTAASHNNGATVLVLASGSWGQWIKSVLKQQASPILSSKPGPIIAAQNAAILQDAATITTTLGAAVQ